MTAISAETTLPANVRRVLLRWSGEGKRFESVANEGPRIVVDGDSEEGPSPMSLLLSSLAGCMAIDVRLILEKSRVPLDSLEVEAVGVRAETPPRRYVSLELIYRVAGPSEEDEPKVQRAVDLSRETYCSVLHTLDPDLDVTIRVERA